MYYGDDQADYTGNRAAYGNWGGMMATGRMGGYGEAQADYTSNRAAYGNWGGMVATPGYYGSPYGTSAPAQTLADVGSRIRPATYTPPTPIYISPSGQYVQRTGIFRDFGNMLGWNDVPRTLSAMDYRLNSASDLADRSGTAAASGLLTLGGIAAGGMMVPVGSALGKFAGRGLGGLAGGIIGPAGAAVGAGIGSTVGGVLGGLAITTLPMMAAAGMGDLLVDQMRMRADLENTSFRYVGAGSSMADPRTGAGMNARTRGKIAEYVTALDVNDPFLDLGEMTRILSGASSLGLMNNTQNIEDFKKRFKDVADNVKNIARVFHTTLEDGLKVMRDFRGIGVADPNQVGRMVMAGERYGLVAGKTGAEMMQVGMQGAELLRGTGISMTIGYQAAQMNLAAVRAARDAGVLEQEAVAQAGGEEALAQRITASGVGYAQSRRGRATAASFWAGGDQFNVGDFARTVRGDISVPEMVRQASTRLADPKKLLEYQVRQEKYLSNVGKTFGGQGFQMMQLGEAMSSAKMLQNQLPGLDTKTAFRSVLKLQMGLSEPEIDAAMSRMENANQEYIGAQRAAETQQARETAESAYQNFFFTRLGSRAVDVLKGIGSVVTNPLGRSIDTARETLKTFAEERTMGLYRADVSNMKYRSGWLQETMQMPKEITLPKSTVLPAGTRIPAGTRTGETTRYFEDFVLTKDTELPAGTVFPQSPVFPEGVEAPALPKPGELVIPVKVGLDNEYTRATRERLESLPAYDEARAIAGSVMDLTGAKGIAGIGPTSAALKRIDSLKQNLDMGVITDERKAQVLLDKRGMFNVRGLKVRDETVGLDYVEMRSKSKLLDRLTLTKEQREIIESTEDYKSAESRILQNIKGVDLNAKPGYKAIILAATGKEKLEDVTPEEMAAVYKYTENIKGGFFGKDKAGDKMAQMLEDRRALEAVMGHIDVKNVASARTRYDKLRTDVFSYLGIDKDTAAGVTEDTFDYLIRAQKESDPERKKALLGEFVGRTSITTGKQVSELEGSMGGLLGWLGKDIGAAYDDIRTLQIGRGRERLKDRLTSRMQLATKKDRAVWKDMIDAADDPRKYLNFVLSHEEFLSKDNLGATIVAKAKDLNAIPGAIEEYKKANEAAMAAPSDENKIRLSAATENARQKLGVIFPGQNLSDETLKEFSKKSQSEIIDQVRTYGVQLQNVDFARDELASGVGGGTAGSQTTTKGSPQEAFTTQVNINYAILQALSALNSSLQHR